mmetsp:Transcript_2029/g.3238  ORF Transcript_2029/g.3238 Transcript_2029/m.3238 type:complete len:209 (-) Transcript_2029:1264-1890(-)
MVAADWDSASDEMVVVAAETFLVGCGVVKEERPTAAAGHFVLPPAHLAPDPQILVDCQDSASFAGQLLADACPFRSFHRPAYFLQAFHSAYLHQAYGWTCCPACCHPVFHHVRQHPQTLASHPLASHPGAVVLVANSAFPDLPGEVDLPSSASKGSHVQALDLVPFHRGASCGLGKACQAQDRMGLDHLDLPCGNPLADCRHAQDDAA